MYLDAINEKVFHLFFDLARRNAALDVVGIFFATYLPYLLVVALIIALIFIKNWRRRFLILIEALLAVLLGFGIVAGAIQNTYNHPRPFVALGSEPLVGADFVNSFPSRHAAFFFSLTPLIFALHRKFGWWYLALITLNGVARVFGGVHWPLDIVGGVVVGVGSGYLIRVLIRPHLSALTSRRREENPL